jgi:hypothetical protein
MWELDDGLTEAERECDDIGHLAVRYVYDDGNGFSDDPIEAHCEHCGREVYVEEWP